MYGRSIAAAVVALTLAAWPVPTMHVMASRNATRMCIQQVGNQANIRSVPCPILVHGRPSSVTVESWQGKADMVTGAQIPRGEPTLTSVIRNAAVARYLAYLFNHLAPVCLNCVMSCPTRSRRVDAFRFGYANGDRWTAYLDWDACGFAWTHGARAAPYNPAPGAKPYALFHYAEALVRCVQGCRP